MSYSILTPYIIPDEQKKHKKINVGDGFIVIGIKKLLSPLECKFEFSTRRLLTKEEIKSINSTKALVIAGANQLYDNYSFLPGADLEYIRQIKVPIIFMGVGFSGHDYLNANMSQTTKDILLELHKNVEYSSWRCFRTTDYLIKNLPEMKEKFLMTGCPVIYNDPLLNHQPFSPRTDVVAVTITERGIWFKREKQTIDFVAKKYKNSKKYLVLHQDFSKNTFKEKIYNLKNFQPPVTFIRLYAKIKGFEVLVPQTSEECQDFYKKCDLHIGSRLHAHLFCLSLAKKSFLTHVDDRSSGFADYLHFPLVKPETIDENLNFDFEIYRQNAILNYKTMETFVNYLKKNNTINTI